MAMRFFAVSKASVVSTG